MAEKKQRRQSSISYFSPSNPANPRSPLSSGGLGRSNSLGLSRGEGKERKTKNRQTVDVLSLEQREREREKGKERPPLTLAEKHADLLHFIAQKESKCLELRSQLAVHESELLQLKRKWERIINRGFDAPSSSASATSNSVIPASAPVLEGIKEGVQGVSRLLAAGFAISEPANKPPASPSLGAACSASPSIQSKRLGRHSQMESISSSSTFTTTATKSTRFSLSSSASSLEEVASSLSSPSQASQNGKPTSALSRPRGQQSKKAIYTDDSLFASTLSDEERDNEQVLIVRDTGATPTMSPNPAFCMLASPNMHPASSPTGMASDLDVLDGREETMRVESTSTANNTVRNTKTLRRRSGGGIPALLQEFEEGTSSLMDNRKEDGKDDDGRKGKRAVSSNGSFGSPANVSSGKNESSGWVGSMGKKLGELQRSPTFTKNQKRASLLLADVSQSFFAVLSPPGSSSTSTPSSKFSSFSAIPESGLVPPVSFSSSSAGSTKSKSSNTSLLDDDDDDQFAPSSSPVLTPDANPLGTSFGVLQPIMPAKVQPPPSAPMLSPRTATKMHNSALGQNNSNSRGGVQDDEDEWNW
ncbi:hypothetical protein BDQ12DRAFT_683966 [Crucibulum laeve]|uniref:Uncharacterized protein n=1 Tax=Crucibulum laeve TaxID=68775 RepID=A0A5C3LZG5_9AGAR|nr:hypothetical protein BDQ12DRAFT_683966 [Crucibulum laeve]